MTFDDVRAIGAGLAQVEEGKMYGSPALKLGKRLIACLAINKSAEPATLVVRTSFEERAALLAEEPRVYYLKPHYENHPVVLVRLSEVSREAMTGLLIAARKHVLANEVGKAGKRKRKSG